MLVGRQSELEAIARWLSSRPDGGPPVLAVVGGPGVGKTSLGRAATSDLPGRIARITTSPAERRRPLVLLTDLARALEDCITQVTGPSRSVLDMLAGWEPFPVEDPLSLGVATLALHAAAVETAPLTVVVDDVHWADQVSLEALAFAWRRLALDPVAVIVTSRPPLPDVLAAIAQVVTLEGLSAADGVALLRANTTNPIDPAVASALVGQARGNPLALTELPRILTPEQLAGRAPLPSELPIGPQAAWSFAAALQSLPERALSALTVVALAGAAAPNHAVAAMERLGLAPTDLAPATEAQLCAAGPGAIAVRHPLVAAAIGEVVPIDERRRVHDALHEACRDAGDEERSAWHLAATVLGASEETATVVEAAAASIRARRGSVAAAALQLKAAELTPAGPERARRLLQAAHDALAANRPVDVLGICAQIEALDADPRVRGQAVLLKAEAGTWSAPPVGLAGELWDLADDEEMGVHALAALLPFLSMVGEIEQLRTALSRLEAIERTGRRLPIDVAVLVAITRACLAIGRGRGSSSPHRRGSTSWRRSPSRSRRGRRSPATWPSSTSAPWPSLARPFGVPVGSAICTC